MPGRRGFVRVELRMPTPVEEISVGGRRFFLKRDDLIHPDFSGNKARKLHYWLRRDLPQIRRVVSYGSPQSNALYSLSVLAKMRGWEFEYFVDHIPAYLRENPVGNYKAALENGTIFYEKSQMESSEKQPVSHDSSGSREQEKRQTDSNCFESVASHADSHMPKASETACPFHGLSAPLSPSCDTSLGRFAEGSMSNAKRGEETLFIEEGGRQREAEEGIRLLAEEIVDWQREKGIETLTVFLPSGTGTTALYLEKSLQLLTPHSSLFTHIVTTPCVGDADYLREQFAMLESEERFWPRIVDLPRKYHFGRLYREFYQLWLELYRQTGVEFDLLYDPKGWLTLLEYRDKMRGEILYLHQGGLKGNESMLPRYRRKYPMSDFEF